MGKLMGQSASYDDPDKVKLLFDVDELQILVDLLSELPYRKSHKMIYKILNEGGPQVDRIEGGK